MGKVSLQSQKSVHLPDMDKVSTYVKSSIVPAKEGRKCVDGRYLPDQAAGMIARPGGDGGYVMALMAVNKKKKLGLTPEQCFNAIYNAVKDDSGFCMHTDHHADPDEMTHIGLIGCGHLAKAASRRFCRDYDVNSDDVEKIINYARYVKDISSGMHVVNLYGDHHERGVFIVNSDKYTILADNPKLSQMYFVYDQRRDITFLKKLVQQIAIPGVTFEDMKEESDLQLQATLQILALGMPIYTVTFEGREPTVQFSGVVQQKHKTIKPLYLRRFPLSRIQQFVHKLRNN